LERLKTLYKDWLQIYRNIERTARFGIGSKIDFLFLEILELIRKSVYAQINRKIVLLDETLEKIDSLRFFFQLLWEAKLIPNKQYIEFGAEIENIGRMIGGWKKGLINKTSAQKAEERKQ